MIRLIYNLFWPIGLLLFLPGYLAKMIRRGGYGEKFGQRLGIYDCEVCVREARIHMAARGKRGGSKCCVETGKGIASARTRFALRSDYDHHNWFRSRNQERSGLDRSHVHTARLLADHAARACGDQADSNRAG